MSWSAQRGVNLIELVVAIAITAILLGSGIPSFRDWIVNTRIRATAQAIQDGLQLARAEAVRRNTAVRFQLMDNLTATCAISTNRANWVVSLGDATSKCDSAPADPPALPTLPDAANPYIIETRSAAEGSSSITLAADQGAFVFNSFGRVTPAPAGSLTVSITDPNSGSCIAGGGKVRCLKVVMSVGGQLKMCDPGASSADPSGC